MHRSLDLVASRVPLRSAQSPTFGVGAFRREIERHERSPLSERLLPFRFFAD